MNAYAGRSSVTNLLDEYISLTSPRLAQYNPAMGGRAGGQRPRSKFQGTYSLSHISGSVCRGGVDEQLA